KYHGPTCYWVTKLAGQISKAFFTLGPPKKRGDSTGGYVERFPIHISNPPNARISSQRRGKLMTKAYIVWWSAPIKSHSQRKPEQQIETRTGSQGGSPRLHQGFLMRSLKASVHLNAPDPRWTLYITVGGRRYLEEPKSRDAFSKMRLFQELKQIYAAARKKEGGLGTYRYRSTSNSYQLLCEMVDSIVGQANMIRSILGLPERELVEDTSQEEVEKRLRKGTTSETKADSKKGEKKDKRGAKLSETVS
ncbi:hypothetical protein OS493_039287, partial [Desmophyllum pertusum]